MFFAGVKYMQGQDNKSKLFEVSVAHIALPHGRLHLNFRKELVPDTYHLQGANGVGKSSLLRAIVGILSFEGNALLEGKSLKQTPVEYKKRVGYCPDTYQFIDSISVRDYLSFVAKAQGIGNGERWVHDAQLIGLEPHLSKAISSLSYGNLKKMLLVSSQLNTPDVWLLDEPLNGLDTQGIEWLEGQLNRRESPWIICVCHDAAWMSRWASEIINLG